ncbi:DUF5694 domain-containing protein [Spirosoma sp. KNUC1025]|uniref:DUF5694 domain-containing protein n=1 Tax=Spirosoma sp. KNUC1025 TaxID=2894082 RepID=UPI001E588C10|nr:DUF5694 domain-containing protein [Spirosoma sp. KNUC1025]UFH57506.1 DUF5694 domain-containing protein [Spirosoma sp. KNUC1025]
MHRSIYPLITLGLALLSSTITKSQPKPVEVLLLGTFHFENPGLDVAKFENANILSTKRQQEVKQVVNQLIAYKPDKIYIEAEPAQQAQWDSLFRLYQQGKFALKANEIYQLAFPLAKTLGHPHLYAADYRQADFPYDSLIKVLTASGQQEMQQTIQTKIVQVEQAFNANLSKYTIGEMLKLDNTPKSRKDNLAFYLYCLGAGKLSNHVGAYLASEWWRRNMVIYANILKQLTGNEKRIVVLFGSSHTAVLAELMKYNSALRLTDVGEVLH